MAVLDGIIIILLVLGILYGTKKGFLNGIISLIGLFVSFIMALLLRGVVADILLKGMPFLKFSGSYKGITSLNILFYEAVAFILVFLFLLSILSLVLKITGIVQKVIDYSVVLTLPSKILGVIVGIINALIISYVMSFIMLNINSTRQMVHDSKIAPYLLKNSVVISKDTKKYYDSTTKINKIIDKCKHEKNKRTCNVLVANSLIESKIIEKEKVIELINSGKLKNISKKEIL